MSSYKKKLWKSAKRLAKSAQALIDEEYIVTMAYFGHEPIKSVLIRDDGAGKKYIIVETIRATSVILNSTGTHVNSNMTMEEFAERYKVRTFIEVFPGQN